MAKKFFSYGFQIERTKKTGIIFLIFVIILGLATFFFIKSKSNITKINSLSYRVTFGINEFEDASCDKAYRINTEKKTCGTICIKITNQDSEYLNKLRKGMEKNGFTLTDTNKMNMNGSNWNYFKTKSSTPTVSYYVINKGSKTYTVEHIDQKKYLTKTEQKTCDKTVKKMLDTIKVK